MTIASKQTMIYVDNNDTSVSVKKDEHARWKETTKTGALLL